MLRSQSAKSGPASRAPIKSRNEQFAGVVSKLHNVARTMDGSLVRRDQFARTVDELRAFALDDQGLAALAQESRSLFAENFSVQRFYDEAFAAILPSIPNAGPTTTNVRMLFARLEQIQTDADIVTPEITLGQDTTLPPGRPFAPNLESVLKVLFDKGTTLEDITYQFNPTVAARHLSLGYTLLTIPDRHCQILVSDRLGWPAYVLDGMRDRKFWSAARPETLAHDSAVTRLDLTSFESLYRSLTPKLPARQMKVAPQAWVGEKRTAQAQPVVPLEQYWDRRRRYELEEVVRFPVLKRQFEQNAPLPSLSLVPAPSLSSRVMVAASTSKPAPITTSAVPPQDKPIRDAQKTPSTSFAGAAKRRGRTIDIRRRNSEIMDHAERYILAYEEFPTSSAPKADASGQKRRSFVVDHMWLTRTQNITLTEMIDRWIDRMAEAYRNGHEGQNPSAMSGTIDGSALTWGIIDAALRKRKRGEAMSLDVFLRRHEPGHAERLEATRAKTADAAATGSPAAGNEQQVRGRRAYDTAAHKKEIWARVEDYALAYNEFPNSSAPKSDANGQMRRSFVVDHMWLTRRADTTLTGLIDHWIDAKADEFRTAHEGTYPTASSGTIEGSKLGWDIVDQALRNRKRGEAMTLDVFLRRHDDGHEDRRSASMVASLSGLQTARQAQNTPDLDPLDQCLAYLEKEGKFPFKLANDQLASEVWKPWVIERIRQFRQKNASALPLKTSGPIAGFEHIDWLRIDQAILANGRQSKINLAQFIEKYKDRIDGENYTPQRRGRGKGTPVARDNGLSLGPLWRRTARTSLLVPDFAKAANGRRPVNMVRIAYDQTVDTPKSDDHVKRRILDFIADGKPFPGTSAEYKSQRERDFWKEQAKWILATSNLPLSKFIMSWTKGLADEFRAAHNGAAPDCNSGPIQGFEGHTWAELIAAYQRDSTKPPFANLIAQTDITCKPD